MKSLSEYVGHTPLVHLKRMSSETGTPIYAKCEYMNPGGSIKDRLAKAIIDDAESRGLLSPGRTLIEATAGNTGMGLAILAATRGYQLVCVMPEKMSMDKRVALTALGANVIITENAPPSSPQNFRRVAERLAQEQGWFLTDQFRNPINISAHERTTGPEIFDQMQGDVGAFVAGAGTGGTISGVGRFLKSRLSNVKIVLADPVGSSLAEWINTGVLGEDGSYAVEGIGGSEVPLNLDRSVVDGAESIPDDESFAFAIRLMKEEGLLVGGSSGTNVAAAVRLAAQKIVHGPIVTVLPDSWDRYRAKPWMQAGVV